MIKKIYELNALLLYTDIDSLCYEITTEDFYQDRFDNKELFDLSDMKLERFKDSENKKVVGKFKNETQGVPLCEFIGLRSKTYSIKIDDESEKKTGKRYCSKCYKESFKTW